MKVITFSKTFPAHHPRKGEDTWFVQKILYGLTELSYPGQYMPATSSSLPPKYHTIRAGERWKVGDKFSARVWSGKPYASKQEEFATIEIKKVWPIGLRMRNDFKELYCNDCDITRTSLELVAKNDGLTLDDFISWFNKPFEGQIICWNENINY